MSSHCSPIVADYYQKYAHNNPFRTSQIFNSVFVLDQKYKVVEKIGSGAYGIVAAAIDQTDPQSGSIAIKKIEKAFEQRIYTKRTLRELKLLRLLSHENIIGQKNIILPRSRKDFEDIYCISELMQTDLAQIIKSDQPLTLDHCKFFIYQVLRGLKYIHSADVIHRDLKPRNLLVNSNCDLKICDFGLARAVPDEKIKRADNLTDYVTTRWYRAPELLLSWTDYTKAVDVWSVGIIFAELLKRKPFLPGQSSSDQLLKIFDIIGTPTPYEISQIPYEEYRKFISEMPQKPPRNFEKLFPKAPREAIDLLQRMLTFDFNKRITVEEALQHPFLQDLHLPEDEPTRDKIPVMEFEFENYNLTRQQYKDLVYEEILLYHYPEFRQQYDMLINNNQSVIQHIVNNDNQNMVDPNDFDEEEQEMQ